MVRAQIEAREEARRRERSPVEAWLLEELREGGGEVDATGALERAQAAGFTEGQVRKARDNLAVSAVKRGFQGKWWWVLFDGNDTFGRPADPSLSDSAAGETVAKGTRRERL